MSNKLLIVGWGRCGKDEAAGFFNDHLGLPYAGSTSWAALPLMAEKLKLHPQLAWERRHNDRQFWKDSCDVFRKSDPLLLVRRALSTPLRPCYSAEDGRFLGGAVFGTVVTGIRDVVEITAARKENIFRNILWIDRPGIPCDPTVTFTPGDATDYVRNDGDLRQFHRNLTRWAVYANLNYTPSHYAMELLLDPMP